MRRIDLHCHSRFSDGSNTPEELLQLAEETDLAAVALTDHDTVAGIPEFLAAGAQYSSVETIPGVELSTLYNGRELHFTGLWINPDCGELLDFLSQMRQARCERNLGIARKLASLGYPVELPEQNRLFSVGRPHFARYILDHYEGFETLQDVFDKLLKSGAAAFVQRKLPSPFEAIRIIREAGGVPVWAHPIYRCRNERAFVRRMLKKLTPGGLCGLECYYSMFGPPETELTLEMAEMFDLAPSGGSDFHGSNSTVSLGTGGGQLFVPETLLEELKARRDVVRSGA